MHWVMPTSSCAAVWPCNTTELKYLPWGCHVAPMWRICPPNVQSHLCTAVSTVRHRLVGMYLTQGSLSSNPRNRCICRRKHNCSGNLPTKPSRGCAGAKYLWLGYPGRNSGQTQPDSPLQSPEVPCVRWARGTERQSRGAAEREDEVLAGRGKCQQTLGLSHRSPENMATGRNHC